MSCQPAAGKDRRQGQPRIAAHEFVLFADRARRQPAPDLDREQFEIMLNEIDNAAGGFRLAQVALMAGDRASAMRRWHRRTGNGRVPTRQRRSTACRR
jgi:hypothetical protein